MTEIISMCIGALIVLISTNINNTYHNRKIEKRQAINEKMKEVDTLILLNKKINEILQKRIIHMNKYTSFNSFDDCYITIDDYIYLQSFCSQNHFYLPTYIVEEFFKNIAHRQVVLSPEEIQEMAGYTYKGGRLILETFSEELIQCAEDRKVELKQLRI